MNNFKNIGALRTWTNDTGGDVASGDVVVVGQQIGIATVDIPKDGTGTVAFEGVFVVPKVSGAVIAHGEMVMWDVSANDGAGAFDDSAATAATGDVSNAAVAAEDAGDGVTSIRIQLANRIGHVGAIGGGG